MSENINDNILKDNVLLVGKSPTDPSNRVFFDVKQNADGRFNIFEQGAAEKTLVGGGDFKAGKWSSDFASGGGALRALSGYLNTHPSYREFTFSLAELSGGNHLDSHTPDGGETIVRAKRGGGERGLSVENVERAKTDNPNNQRVESLQESLDGGETIVRAKRGGGERGLSVENVERAKTDNPNNQRVESLQESLSERMKANKNLLDTAEKDPDVLQRWIHTEEPESVLTAPGSKINNYISYDPGLVRQRFAEDEFSARNWKRIQLATSMPGFGLGAGIAYLLGGDQRVQDAAGFALAALLVRNQRANTTSPKMQAMPARFRASTSISKGWRDKQITKGKGRGKSYMKKGIADVRRRNKTREIHPSTANEGFRKKPNWPSVRKVKVRMWHVIKNHTERGEKAKERMAGTEGTSLWPVTMSDKQIRKVILDAYRNIDARISVGPGEQHTVQGTSGRFRVEMAVDLISGTINTAYLVN